MYRYVYKYMYIDIHTHMFSGKYKHEPILVEFGAAPANGTPAAPNTYVYIYINIQIYIDV